MTDQFGLLLALLFLGGGWAFNSGAFYAKGRWCSFGLTLSLWLGHAAFVVWRFA